MAICILFLPIKAIAKLGSSFMLICDTLTNSSCIVYRHYSTRGESWYKPKFKTPFFPITPILGIVCELVMLGFLGYEGLFAVMSTVGLGSFVYMVYGRHHAAFHGLLALDELLGVPPLNAHDIKQKS